MTFLKLLSLALVGLGVLLAVYTYGATRWLEYRFPPLGEFVEVDGERLHYLAKGQGPPLVLLHGANASLRDMDASIFHDLAEDFHVIAFDRPGYGYSTRATGKWQTPLVQARLIHKALEKLRVENPVLVGHSWAGSVVLAYLLDFPDNTSGGVLLAGATNAWEGGVSTNVQLAGVPLFGELFASILVMPVGQAVFGNAIEAVFAPEQPTSAYLERTGAMLALRPTAFQSSAEDVRRLSSFLEVQRERYEEIEAPLLLITAEKDTIVPAWNHANKLVETLPHAELVELPGAGHALHHSRAKEVLKLISTFTERNTRENGL